MLFDIYIGTAAVGIEDQPETTMLEVVLSEILPHIEGEPNIGQDVTMAVTNSAPGTSGKRTFRVSQTVPAEYFFKDSGTSRPDIAKAEKVIVIAPAGTTSYRWIAFEQGSNKRKYEEITKFIKSSGKVTDGEHSPENSYTFHVSTKKGRQRILVETTDLQGEAITFHLDVDLANGNWGVADNKENTIFVEALLNKMLLAVKGSNVILTPSEVTINAPKITLNGETFINGALATSSTVSAGGSLTVAGSIAADGNVTNSAGGYLHHH